MPRTIPNDIKTFNIRTGDAGILRPALSAEAGRIFGLWTSVEMMVATLLSTLVSREEALETLDSLRAKKNARNDEIKRLARENIQDTELLDLFNQVTSFVVKAARPRNKLAHWIWGTHEAYPDALLLTNPDTAVKFSRAILFNSPDRFHSSEGAKSIEFSAGGSINPESVKQLMVELKDTTEIWTQSEFELPRKNLYNSLALLTSMCTIFGAKQDTRTASDGILQIRQMLMDFS